MKNFGRLELISFITGFVLMCFELVAARLLAPSIGSSTYVWTSVIGVIIAALAAGYWAGGVVADRRNARRDVAYLLLLTALMILLAQVLYSGVLPMIALAEGDPRIQGVIATLLLFAPASFVMGMISPYLAKLNVTSLSVSGRRVASLGALNSVGGIVGTFLTGFVLLSVVGTHQLLTVLIILLVATSWLVAPSVRRNERILISITMIVVALIPAAQTRGIVNIDTPSAHYQVVDALYEDRPITALLTGTSGIQSAVYKGGDDGLVFWYTREMARLTIDHQPNNVLMLGGGAFTLPHYLAKELPDTKIDAVEIDPSLIDIAKEHFDYSQSPQVTEHFDDARRFINMKNSKYDVILIDVYGDGAIPFTFATAEYGQQIDRLLAPDGIVVANIIGGLTSGPCLNIFQAVDSAYREYFRYGYYSTEKAGLPVRANIVATYSRTQLEESILRPISIAKISPYTDNFAPTDQLYHACEQI